LSLSKHQIVTILPERFKTRQQKVDAIFTTEEEDSTKLEKMFKGTALYLLSGAAAFSMEVAVYADRGWLLGAHWWLATFLPAALWMLAPYLGLSSIIVKMQHTLRQLIVLFFGSAGMAAFGIFMLFDGFFIHVDPRSRVMFWIVPMYQWVALAGTAALRTAVGRKPPRP